MGQADIRSLEDIWPLQAELNRRAGFDTAALGEALAAAGTPPRPMAAGSPELKADTLPAEGDLRLEVGRALKNYIDALAAECHEMLDCTAWKHWYAEAKQGRQYELRDIQNARVEATDMLFFWISICQLLGLTPGDVYRLYAKKLDINHRRQDEARSQAEHGRHEDENRAVV